MTIKTVYARNLPLRTGFAYAGTEGQPFPPTMATAYHRNEGTITIATVRHGILEVRPGDRVRYATDPIGDGATNLRWCHTCPHRHLLRLSTGIKTNAYCDFRAKELNAARKATRKNGDTWIGPKVRQTEEQHAAMLERIDTLIHHRPRTRDELIDIQLRNSARWDGTGSARFAELAHGYRVPLDEAKQRAHNALALADLTDASAPKVKAS